jgi:hypothetical protein
MRTERTSNVGGVTAKQTTITAQVISVDRANNTVRVKAPNNQIHTIAVNDPTLQQRLSTVQPGDNVTISYTQAVAVAAAQHGSNENQNPNQNQNQNPEQTPTPNPGNMNQ